MLSKAFYAIFLFSFIIDIFIRQNEKELTNNNVSSNYRQQDLIPNESDDKVENIEIPEKNKISHGSSLKIKQGEEDLKVNMEGVEKEQFTGEKIILSIQYCGGSNYLKNYEDLRKQMMDSYQNVEIYGAEYPLPFVKKVLSKVIWFAQMFLITVIVGGDNLKPYLTFLPDRFFTFVNEKKWMLGIFSFFVGNQLSSAVGSTGAFEIYCNESLIWSKLQRNTMPTVEQLASMIKSFGYELV